MFFNKIYTPGILQKKKYLKFSYVCRPMEINIINYFQFCALREIIQVGIRNQKENISCELGWGLKSSESLGLNLNLDSQWAWYNLMF